MAFLRMLEWRAKYGVTPLRVCGPSLGATIYFSAEMQASLLCPLCLALLIVESRLLTVGDVTQSMGPPQCGTLARRDGQWMP